ncbi:hypothetical protein [Mesobacillus selenatarsenatis]|uniref:Uncharacterized protein n=1 Tax=Mesobacillus selenatarsenatis TaxID=388741 RepID=A0A846TGI9_9BACI|nr:hypothetical protein [Mesobacillus selenatarsenatis]NKE07623.1 hypothetical protein [Mesobacillus selenatarsenatis]
MISLIDLPELQMIIAWLEVVGVLVDLLGKVELDKFKHISLVTNYTRRLQQLTELLILYNSSLYFTNQNY